MQTIMELRHWIRSWGKIDLEWGQNQMWYSYEYPNAPTWRVKVMVYTDIIRCQLKGLVCIFLQHKWVDDSYGGPESGYESIECMRCGESHFQRMY